MKMRRRMRIIIMKLRHSCNTHIRFSPYAVCLHSTTTNLHVFHSLSCSFLLVAGGDSLTHQDLSSQCGESRLSCAVSEGLAFMPWKDSGLLASRTQCCGTPGHRSLKHIELRLSRKNRDAWDLCVSGNILPAQQPVTGAYHFCPTPLPIPVIFK